MIKKSTSGKASQTRKTLRFGIIARIAAGFTIVTALLMVITGLSLFNGHKVETQFNQLVNETTPYADDSQSLARHFLLLETQVRSIAAATDTETLVKYDALRLTLSTQILKEINSLKQRSANDPENLKHIENITNQYQSLTNIADNIVTARKDIIQVSIETAAISAELSAFTKAFVPMFDELSFDLVNWQESEVTLFEVQSIVLSGLLYVEQIKSSNDPKEIDFLSGGEIINWMNSIIPVAIKLKNKENTEQTDEFVKEVFSISEKILIKIRGLGGPQEGNSSGLARQRIIGLELDAKIQESLINFNESISSISNSINSLVNSSKNQTIAIEKSVVDQFANSKIAMITISIIGLIIAALISFVITLTFKSSLKQLKEILAKLAQGDFTTNIKKPKNDEMGDLEHHIKTVSDALKDLIGDIQKTFEQVEHSVQNSRALSKQTREHVISQKEQLDNVGNALTDMNKTSAEVAKYAEQTHEKVENADEFAKQGSHKVNSNQIAIQSVSDHFKQAQNTIIELDTGVHDIEGILKTIGSIADQTNLLALNAAIEAARAGEQGRGFAVVADEVRSLANRTQQSTAEIQAMTLKMINGSKQAVQMMEESNERIGKSLESAQEAKNTISEFTGIMDGIRNISHLIATAAEEQSLVSNEVSGNIEHVTALAEKTENAAMDSTDSAKQLQQLSHVLTQKLAQFKI